MGKNSSTAVLLVRWLGLIWLSAGLWMLAANVIESASEFNPSFTGYYLQSQAVRPLLAMGLGGLLMLLAKPVGRWLAKNLDKADHG